jgi:hypothetical protein
MSSRFVEASPIVQGAKEHWVMLASILASGAFVDDSALLMRDRSVL